MYHSSVGLIKLSLRNTTGRIYFTDLYKQQINPYENKASFLVRCFTQAMSRFNPKIVALLDDWTSKFSFVALGSSLESLNLSSYTFTFFSNYLYLRFPVPFMHLTALLLVFIHKVLYSFQTPALYLPTIFIHSKNSMLILIILFTFSRSSPLH
jgi:hypothetical protein